MSHNIVIAGRVSADQNYEGLYNRLANGLRTSARLQQSGRERPVVSVATDMESVQNFIEDDDVTALIITEKIMSFNAGTEYIISKQHIREWRDAHPDMLIVLVLPQDKKGGIKLKNLFEIQYYNALFVSDLNPQTLIDLILKNGRSKAEAGKYYGLLDVSAKNAIKGDGARTKDNAPKQDRGDKPNKKKPQPEYEDDTEDDDDVQDDLEYREPAPKKKQKKSGYIMKPMDEPDGNVAPVKAKEPKRRPIVEDDEDDEEEVEVVRVKKPKKQIVEEYDEVEEEPVVDSFMKEEAEIKPKKKTKKRKVIIEEYEDDEDEDEMEEPLTDPEEPEEDDMIEEEDYVEEEPEPAPAPQQQQDNIPIINMYPASKGERLYFGEIVDIVDDRLIVSIPGGRARLLLSNEFIGTQVYFFGRDDAQPY